MSNERRWYAGVDWASESHHVFLTDDAGRKLGEKIIIQSASGPVVVTVVKIDRNQIRIGIEAPGEIPVYREEIAPMRIDRTATEVAV